MIVRGSLKPCYLHVTVVLHCKHVMHPQRGVKHDGAGVRPAEIEVLLVAPQDGWPCLDSGLGQHVVQIHDLVSSFVSHDDEHGPLFQLVAVLHQSPDPGIYFLPHDHRTWIAKVYSSDASLRAELGVLWVIV